MKQIEIAATLLPRGIFRARPTGSCCINSSLDLSLGSDGPVFPLLFLMFSDFSAFCNHFLVCNFSAEQGESSVSFLYIPSGLEIRSCLASVWMHASSSVQQVARCPLPSLSHELNHPTHDFPLPLPTSPEGEMTARAQQALQWQLHGSLSAHSLGGSRPHVIFSQPEVSRTYEMVQHLAQKRGWSVWDRYLICRSNVEADVGFSIVWTWSDIVKKKISLHKHWGLAL